MLDELRQAATRQLEQRALRRLLLGCKRLLSERGETNSMAIARGLVGQLDALQGRQLDELFEHLAQDYSPDPQETLQRAQAYAEQRDAASLIALVNATEPPRQELLRRLNRTPGGTAAIVRLRRELLTRLPKKPELLAVEADMLHLLNSWFNPGFLTMRRVDWNSRAVLLEKIMRHEAVHAIDGWDDLRRRLQPDRRCFAFFHPQLPDEPLIFVEVALLADMPEAIAPLIDKHSEPGDPAKARVAAFYSISNCEPGLRGVSLGNFLIKSVAEQLQGELPRLRTFCTLSPIPGLARWLLAKPDFAALPKIKPQTAAEIDEARAHLEGVLGGDLSQLQRAASHEQLDGESTAALLSIAATYLLYLSPTEAGDPVARFHLDNGARLERLNARGNLSARGLKESFGVMVNYLYDLGKVEASHEKFKQGEVARSRAVHTLM